MAHTLVLLRHAKSDWSGGERDVDRPLAGRGRRQAPSAGAWLAAHAEPIDLAVVSSATRARQTWALAAAELRVPPPVRVEPRAYAAADDELLEVVRGLPEKSATVVLVGHNPGMEDLVLALTGEYVALPTSALAVLELPAGWASAGAGAARLRAAGRPPGAAPRVSPDARPE